MVLGAVKYFIDSFNWTGHHARHGQQLDHLTQLGWLCAKMLHYTVVFATNQSNILCSYGYIYSLSLLLSTHSLASSIFWPTVGWCSFSLRKKVPMLVTRYNGRTAGLLQQQPSW